MNRLITVAAVLALSACTSHPKSTPEPIITTVKVNIPVAVGCVPANLAVAPDYPDTDAAIKSAADAASRYQLLYAGRKVRSARLAELEPIVNGCPKAASK